VSEDCGPLIGRGPIEGDVPHDLAVVFGHPCVDSIRTGHELPQLVGQVGRVAVSRSHDGREGLAPVEV
jgi:hypothetical protein